MSTELGYNAALVALHFEMLVLGIYCTCLTASRIAPYEGFESIMRRKDMHNVLVKMRWSSLYTLDSTAYPRQAVMRTSLLLQELGYNAIHFNQLAHSWIRNVRILNSDSAFYSWGMVFSTITGG
jgi:hypothetical protein